MRRALAVALAASLGLALPVSAQDIRFQPKMSSTTVKAGTGTGSLTLGGVLCKGAPAQATTGTSEEILATCTIPAATLSTNGSMLVVRVFGITAANANNKTLKIRVGGIGGTVVYNSFTVGANNQDFWMLEPTTIQRTGATTAAVWGYGAYNNDASVVSGVTSFGTYTNRAAAITWANANDLVITGTTPTAAGDMTLTSYSVEVVQ